MLREFEIVIYLILRSCTNLKSYIEGSEVIFFTLEWESQYYLETNCKNWDVTMEARLRLVLRWCLFFGQIWGLRCLQGSYGPWKTWKTWKMDLFSKISGKTWKTSGKMKNFQKTQGKPQGKKSNPNGKKLFQWKSKSLQFINLRVILAISGYPNLIFVSTNWK